MARMAAADWRKIDINYNINSNRPRLYVVHIAQGSYEGTIAWFNNKDAQASSHFVIARDGRIAQLVDTDNKAWHAAGANDHSVGVEHEGFAGNPLTDAAVNATAKVLAWSIKQHEDISEWLTTNPDTGSGLAYHGLGGNAWGGHPGCPGSPIVNQLPLILKKAKAILHPFAANPVTNLSAEARYTQIDVDWTGTANADSYQVTYWGGSKDTISVNVPDGTFLTLTNLDRETTYTIQVMAKPNTADAVAARTTATTLA
jgi:hypothetical protein